MRWLPASRPQLMLALLCAGAAALFVALAPGRSARAGETLRASNVCEAQELKARKEKDPDLQIEIPAEFDRPFPTLLACQSYAAASDPTAPGPLQPIPFSHKHHAGDYQIECLYCHSGTDRSRAAGVPSLETCMGCHANFPAEYDEFEGIRTLKQHWKDQQAIPWVQVYRLPEHVKFRHQRHVKAGLDCQTCHGPVQQENKLYLLTQTQWWPWLLPTKTLEMGWCVMCHREKGASTDCLTCHQ